MELEKRLITLRKNVRKNQKKIIDRRREDHLKKQNLQKDICIFCGTSENLTKEHVLPKWIFNNCYKKFFITTTNDVSQTYSKTTLPACKNCNSFILGYLETHIKNLLKNTDLTNSSFTNEELEKIILWLELIEYKFQHLDLKRKFNKQKDHKFIEYLADFPIGILANNASLSPAQVFSNLRNSLKKLSVKSKTNRLNSLLMFKSSNPDFHFFHKTNDYLFFDLPDYKIAIFYFINKEFKEPRLAHEAATNIIKTQYEENKS